MQQRPQWSTVLCDNISVQGCHVAVCTLYFLHSEGSPRSGAEGWLDHSLVSAAARFTVLWPGPKAWGGWEALWIPAFQELSVGTEWQSLKPQNPQGIKALSVRASGSNWQVETRTDVLMDVEEMEGGEDNCLEQGESYYTTWSKHHVVAVLGTDSWLL